ncbi:N-acetylglucosamine-6-phosphate deacetylase [Weissella diestrammenae]|uniref:N-acetylglucosamine-6-phosphate deacetylase n=1 Tax=Weissella diestrammenae TaxID=1162633 RepID=A0A7G9T3W0_9LACO|nr:N-acetylglucosamine-6-phosphate deacetylase [Weissella diestrammenae]MCM0582110.1 N-acetylglucosamine-6-phosphate deacetylase [Weissella diestrammenae]QNN74785.1 N-acetylglucosamine-6-phosphate deacetylase [Weissella diestrammenae]
MSKVVINAKIYTGTGAQPVIEQGFIRFDKQIEAIGAMADYQALATDESVLDAQGANLVPGFIDVHTHGAYGFDTMDGDADEIVQMVRDEITEGITSVFPTTMTQSVPNIDQAMRAINQAAAEEPAIMGVHLEGPFINPHFKGAQPEKYIIAPSVEKVARWNELSGQRVRLITYAPERAENLSEFENYLKANNIIGSVGHSDATREFLQTHSKVKHVTHLYNAQRPMKHRDPGVTGHAMLDEDMYAEMIVDGFHIAPDMVKVAWRLKGAHRIDLITDSMRAKGIGEGISELGGQKVWVKDGQARLEDGTLAGSVLQFKHAFLNMMAFTGATVQETVQMASVNQAKEFGLTNKGTLEVGKDADFNLFDAALTNLEMTYSLGRQFKPSDAVIKN